MTCRETRLRVAIAILAMSPILPLALRAQELALLKPEHLQLISQEISGDAAYGHIRFMTQFHRPRGGHDGLWAVAQYYERQAREVGLSDVKLIKQTYEEQPWNARFADLWIVEPAPERIASTLQSVVHLADFSRPADVTGELVDLNGATPRDYEGRDLRGKVVLTYGSLTDVMVEAVLKRGALGVVWYPDPFSGPNGIVGSGVSRPDAIRWISLPSGTIEGKEPTFAFGLSVRQGIDLHNRLARAGTPIKVHARVDAGFQSGQGTEPWQVMVEGIIPGSDPGARQDVVLTGHLQEEGYSANDDASGSANTLEIARALNRLIASGQLPRPKRTLRFWWVTEISSQRQYFADNPEASKSMWVTIGQDMVGADQSQDVMRKQNVTRLPATRFHFFNDVMESVLEYMVRSNTFELNQMENGFPLYPQPHLSHLGSMQRFNAEAIWFHYSTDHMTFLEAPIGLPGISFTNMPDRFIHSTDDDLWNIDRTQLGRSAVTAALIGYVMASADSTAVPALLAQVAGRGNERMGRNLRLGLEWLGSSADRTEAFHRAQDQVRYAAERERRAVGSLAEIGPGAAALADPMVLEIGRRELQALRELEVAYRSLTGARRLPERASTAVETELGTLRPVLVGGPKEFLGGRRRIERVAGLHSMMAAEVLNAIDGRRTGLDIYRLVAAEAREAGTWYFGTVKAEAVLSYLGNLERAGLARLR